MKEIYKLLAGRISTNIGDSVILIALTWYVAQNYKDNFYLGILGFIVGVVELLIIFVGPIIDRYSVKKILVISTICQIFIVTIITVLLYMESLHIVLLYILVCLSVFFSSIIYPTENTLIPILSDSNEMITKNNSLFQISYKGLDIVLNGIIGFLLSVFLISNLMSVNIIIFCIALYLFKILKLPPNKKEKGDTSFISEYIKDFKIGIHFIRKPLVLKLLLPLTLINFVYTGVTVLFPKLALFYGNSTTYGFILLINGLGIMLGFIISPYILKKMKFNKLLYRIFILISIFWILLFLTYEINLYITMAFLFISSVFIGILNLTFITAFQIIPPKELLGRVATINETIISLLIPIGTLLGSLLADLTKSIQYNFLMVGIISFIIAIYYFGDKEIRGITKLENLNIKDD